MLPLSRNGQLAQLWHPHLVVGGVPQPDTHLRLFKKLLLCLAAGPWVSVLLCGVLNKWSSAQGDPDSVCLEWSQGTYIISVPQVRSRQSWRTAALVPIGTRSLAEHSQPCCRHLHEWPSSSLNMWNDLYNLLNPARLRHIVGLAWEPGCCLRSPLPGAGGGNVYSVLCHRAVPILLDWTSFITAAPTGLLIPSPLKLSIHSSTLPTKSSLLNQEFHCAPSSLPLFFLFFFSAFCGSSSWPQEWILTL